MTDTGGRDRSRRRVLGALATVTTGAIAGCSTSSDPATTSTGTTASTGTATDTATATETETETTKPIDPPNVERQIILRDKAAIMHVRRVVSGEITWPSFETYNVVDPTVLGVWERGDTTLAFDDDKTFEQVSGEDSYEGRYFATDGLLGLTYSDGSELDLEYSVTEGSSGVELVLETSDGDTVRYSRVRDYDDERDIVQVFEDSFVVEESNPVEEGGEIRTASTGSGFNVHPDGYVVTNAHVVGTHRDPEESLYVRLALQTQTDVRETLESEFDLTATEQEAVEGILFDMLFDYFAEESEVRDVSTDLGVLHGTAEPNEDVGVRATSATVETTGSVTEEVSGEPTWGRDVAILNVDGQRPLPTVPLGDSTSLGTGAKTVVVGYPAIGIENYFEDRETTLEPTLTSGVVSARRTLRSGVEAIQTDAGINNGNSGGPMYNGDGEVVGIATFKPTDVDLEEVAFGLPVETATGFLGEIGVEPERGELDRRYQEGLNALWRDDCETLRERMSEVRELWPDHPYVGDVLDAC